VSTVSIETDHTLAQAGRSDEPSDDESGGDPTVDDERGETANGSDMADAWRSPRRRAVLFGAAMFLALAALVGWLTFRVHESQQLQKQQADFVAVGRQGAIDLTTIDWQHADSDIQRILNAATGFFHDDFSQRSQPFIDVVKKAQSTSVGTVTAAGLESSTANDAQVLVAVSVKTSNAGAAEAEPRAWRMRISLQKVGSDVKISNVEFVP
jgi:Mce-associated membrane protein